MYLKSILGLQKRLKVPVMVLVEPEGPGLLADVVRWEAALLLVCLRLRAAPILTVAARVPVPVLPIHRIRKQVSPTSPS